MTLTDIQIEGLVGPTHNYAGLSPGNVASANHKGTVSHPKAAALQNIEKMRFVHDLGASVVVMPPHLRPHTAVLDNLNMTLDTAAPNILAAAYSASNMWVANAGTISASTDTKNGTLHITPANLISHLHRSIEADISTTYLHHIFPQAKCHFPLPASSAYSDEGAANHMRLCGKDETDGIDIFVYGIGSDHLHNSARFPARQHLFACQAVARSHQLDPENVFYLRQSSQAIDAGVFHNDVIAMSHKQLLIVHEDAYDDTHACLNELRSHRIGNDLDIRIITNDELSLSASVATYFFNAQLLDSPDGGTIILFPQECAEHDHTNRLAHHLLEEMETISAIHFIDVRESMQNGGGPACLRLRVPMTQEEIKGINSAFMFNKTLEARLNEWIHDHYRDELHPDDLRDPELAKESFAAFDVLKEIFPIEL